LSGRIGSERRMDNQLSCRMKHRIPCAGPPRRGEPCAAPDPGSREEFGSGHRLPRRGGRARGSRGVGWRFVYRDHVIVRSARGRTAARESGWRALRTNSSLFHETSLAPEVSNGFTFRTEPEQRGMRLSKMGRTIGSRKWCALGRGRRRD